MGPTGSFFGGIPSYSSVIPEKNVLGQKGNVRTGLLARRQNNFFTPVCYYMLPLKELVKLNIKCYPTKICRTWFLSPVLSLAHSLVTSLSFPICKVKTKRSLRFLSILSVNSPYNSLMRSSWPCCPQCTDVETEAQRRQRVSSKSHSGFKVTSDSGIPLGAQNLVPLACCPCIMRAQ